LDITNLVRKWYAKPGENYGVLLEADESAGISVIASENNAYAQGAKPVIYVNYVSNAGMESYLNYESFDVGRAGSMHVALHSGHLLATRNLTATNGNRMPVSLELNWNECEKDKNAFGVGLGWRLNWNQTLRREAPENGNYYYIWTDGDGTEHEFKKHTKTEEEEKDTSFVDYFEDESGLSLKLYEGSEEAEIVSKGHDKLVFALPVTNYTENNNAICMIERAEDAHGNGIRFEYDTNKRLTKATDGAGRATTLNYTDAMVSISSPGYENNVTLLLENGSLRLVVDPDQEASEYVYDESTKRMTAIHNLANGQYAEAIYDAAGRVTRMQKYALTDGVRTDGNARGYEYFDCVTQVSDLTVDGGKRLTYQFNDRGNVVAVQDEMGFAAFAKYSTNGKPNTPEEVSKLQRLVLNLLDAHDFREESGWEAGVIRADGTAEIYERMNMRGDQPLVLERPGEDETSYAEYQLECEAGEYTFSVYALSQGDALAWAEVSWKDAENQWHTTQTERIKEAQQPVRLTCTFENEMAGMIRIRVLAGEGNGRVCFEHAQLEEGALANHHNMLHHANFTTQETGEIPAGWLLGEGVEEEEKEEKEETDEQAPAEEETESDEENKRRRLSIAEAENSATKPQYLGGNCLRMQGAPGKKLSVYQELSVSGEKGDNYVVGGWCRAWAAPAGEGRTFRVRVRFRKPNGIWKDGGTADWNEEWVDWQYACGAAVAPSEYDKLRVYIEYDGNLNEAQIGAVSLVREYYGQTYAYDEKNNITAVSTLLGEKSNAEYDEYDNVTSYVQPGREKTEKYTLYYGESEEEKKRHLPLRSETPLGLLTETEYDAYGNATKTKARHKDETAYLESRTTYTEDGNYVKSVRDARGYVQTNEVEANKGVVLSTTNPKGQTVYHDYDAMNRVTQTYSETDAGRVKNEYTYEKDRLARVSHNTDGNAANDVVYTFEYDALGNATRVKVGTQTLSENRYTETGDKLLTQVTYGNGGNVSYGYDSFKRVTSITQDKTQETDAPRFMYEYGANGALARVKDLLLKREERTGYDAANRPVEAEQYENGALRYRLTQEYDRYEQPTVLHERMENADDSRKEYTTRVAYDAESKPTSVTYESTQSETKQRLDYEYDGLGRVKSRRLYLDSESENAANESRYTYIRGGYGNGSATALIRKIEQRDGEYEYWYDETGNIVKERYAGQAAGGGELSFEGSEITCEGALTLEGENVTAVYNTTYEYDVLGQLIRVNEGRENATWTYKYDHGGNILEKKKYAFTEGDLENETALETIPYVYGDANWKDKLTSYNGREITYDAIGNPLTYDGWTFTWKAGRQLASMVSEAGGVNAAFEYNQAGLRVKKTVNGVETV